MCVSLSTNLYFLILYHSLTPNSKVSPISDTFTILVLYLRSVYLISVSNLVFIKFCLNQTLIAMNKILMYEIQKTSANNYRK